MKAFDDYVSNYDLDNKKISLKYEHSYRVRELSNMLATKLKLDSKDIELASLIGLLHDIGRFEQATKYDVLNDTLSIDHGDLGEEILFTGGLINNFSNDIENNNIIRVAVKGHNKYLVDEGLDSRSLLHLKIIRDADKIDILNIYANLNLFGFNCEGEVSEEVKDAFYNHKSVLRRKNETGSDVVISIFAFIFDINFKDSLEYIYEHKFISKIYDKLGNREKVKDYYDYISNYMEEKIKGDR